uniref:Titin n=1 Tax=Seriola dumerili TaxID=41447 RepID=A0A3B4THA0_SERDU
MVLSWTVPEQTGGADIEGYHLEKRDKDSVRWTKCNRQKLTDTHFKVTGLMTDHFYEFRVAAENEAGMGDLSELSLFYRACDATTPPGPPHHPKVTDYTKSSVSLSWGKPDFDGGAYVKGYIVEMREYTPVPESTEEAEEAPAVEAVVEKVWTMCTPPTGIQATKLTITDLKEGGEYQFRICAINSEGVGEAANIHGTVVTSDRVEAPEIELDADLRKVVSVRAGGTLRLFVTIRGRPEPAVKWEKVEGTLTDRAAVDTTSSYTMLVIDNVNRFDSGKYSLTLENSSGTKSAIVAVRILDTPSAPQNFAVKELKKDSVTLAWDSPLTDGGSKITNYIVEKRESVRKAYTTVTSNCTANSFKIEELPEGGMFYFRVCAVNEYGQGQMVETKEVKISEVPLPPSKVTLVDLTKTSVSLAWEKPAHDGGSKVMCYNVEFKPKSGDKWGTACTVKVPEATIPNLTPNEAYLFRVVAINEKGKSEPKDLGLPVVAKDVAIEPSVNLLFTTYSVKAGDDLTLEVPVRGRPKPVVSWKKDGLPLKQTSSTRYDVTGLTENSQYDFRVIAKNAAGLFSEPSDNTGPIIIKDDVDPPRIMMDVKFRETVFVKAGETLKINADLAGRPAPVISWTKDGKEIELRARIQIVSTDTSTSVIVKDCSRRDSGQYVLTLQNIAGTVTMPINCVILDKPGPSAGPLQITGLTAEECTLSWGPPQEIGGANITHYVVEKRETSRLAWTLVKGDVTKTYFKVTGLLKGNEYIFRVLAVNKHGLGEALESEAIKVTDPYTFATAPASVDVTTITGDSMTLTWCKPASDGGSPITGYVIERREKTGMRWVRVNRDPVVECTTVATKLRKGCEYDFRVYAENAAGLSPPSEPSATFRAMDPLVVPSRPTKPKIVSSTKDKEEDEEEVPESPEDLARWVEAIPLTKSLEFTIKGLKTDAEYEFCVKTINKVGSSVRSLYSDAAAAMDRTSEPSFDVDIEMRKVHLVKHSTAFTLNVPFKGKPVPSVDWTKEGVDLKRLLTEVTPDSLIITLHESISSDAGKYEVTASNAGGTTKIFIIFVVLDRPGPPVGPVAIGEVGETTVCLKWAPPEYDGGSPITGYSVERREAPNGRWVKANFTNIIEMGFTVSGLTQDESYEFRVYAKNAVGSVSNPSLIVGPVTCIDACGEFLIYIYVKLRVGIIAKPLPTIEWLKNGKELVASSTVSVENSTDSSAVLIKDATRLDTGSYEIKIKNVLGSASATIRIEILGMQKFMIHTLTFTQF